MGLQAHELVYNSMFLYHLGYPNSLWYMVPMGLVKQLAKLSSYCWHNPYSTLHL